jgi:hypothetical protein
MRSVPAKPKLYPFVPRSEAMRSVMRSCAFVLAVNWLAQGMRGMDRKELTFRLLAELVLGAGLFAVLAGLDVAAAALVSAFAAHSLSFTLNGQFWVCARYCPSYQGDPAELRRFLDETAAELRQSRSIETAVVIGSLAEGALGPRSDLDLRLIFPPGARAWLEVNLVLLRLRAQAFARGIPLDAYAYDSVESLARFDPAEPWLLLADRRGEIARRFPGRRLTCLP